MKSVVSLVNIMSGCFFPLPPLRPPDAPVEGDAGDDGGGNPALLRPLPRHRGQRRRTGILLRQKLHEGRERAALESGAPDFLISSCCWLWQDKTRSRTATKQCGMWMRLWVRHATYGQANKVLKWLESRRRKLLHWYVGSHQGILIFYFEAL